MNTKPMTREEIIEEISLRLEELNPNVLSEYLVMLSVYLSNMSETIATNTKIYYNKWVAIRESVETDGHAEKRAKATQEYYNKNLIQLQYDSTVEIINALKKRLAVFEAEYRNSGNQ